MLLESLFRWQPWFSSQKLIFFRVFVCLCGLFFCVCVLGFCFCLFDFSSSAITIYRIYSAFWYRSVDDRKTIKLLRKKTKREEHQNLIAHKNDAQIWRSCNALVFKSVGPIYRHSQGKIKWLEPVAMVTHDST